MPQDTRHWLRPLPPFRATPESCRRIMRTSLAVLILPAAAAAAFFGYHAFKLMLVSAVCAGLTEFVTYRARPSHRLPGSTTHSIMMGLLLSFTLPATTPWHIAAFGAVCAVLIGKVVLGGLGRYVWHPALIGRIILQILFADQLTAPVGPLLGPGHIFLGNIHSVTESQWLNLNWFSTTVSAGTDGLLLPLPLASLRSFADLHFLDGSCQLARYLLEHLPPLGHCIVGATPGSLGQTSGIAIILAGVYLIYRGYMPWHMPVAFITAAYAAAALCPIILNPSTSGTAIVHLPITADGIAAGLTYANYHIFTGSLLLAACLLTADMTSRPITLTGQTLFAAGAGLMTIILRLYTHIAIPALAAVLAMNTLTGLIDRFTRPKLPKLTPKLSSARTAATTGTLG